MGFRPSPRSLQAQLLVTYLALVVFGLGGVIIWTGQRLQAEKVHQVQRDLGLQATLAAGALAEVLEHQSEAEQAPLLERLLQLYARNTGTRMTLQQAGVRDVVSSDREIADRVDPGREAEQGDGPRYRVEADQRGEKRLRVTMPIRSEHGAFLGSVQLSRPMAEVDAEIRGIWLGLFLVGGAMLAATAVASLYVARRVVAPVKRLTSAARAVAEGRLEQEIRPAGPRELHQLARVFSGMAERVREALARQKGFAAHAAHEFRSPLTALRLRLDLLQDLGGRDPEVGRRYLAEMAEEVDHLHRLVEHLLALSALDEEAHSSRLPVDLAPVLYDLVEEMSPFCREAGVTLRVEVPPHLPDLTASAEQIRVAVRNLLDNALKHTPAGGRITLTAHSLPAAIQIEVDDTGIGIPPEALPRLFQRFFRVEPAWSRGRSGAGLGLALVRAVVEAHGGRVEVTSQPGRGSTFTITMPFSPLSSRSDPSSVGRRPTPR